MNKVLWHSNAPWAPTGYGSQTALFAPRIQDLGYEVTISAFWGLGGAKIEWNGMEVLPADEDWGNRLLPPYAVYVANGDSRDVLTITLMDVWVLRNIEAMKKLRLASWVPVDHEPAPAMVHNWFKESGSRPIAMSKFGQRMLADQGLDPLYIPHGVDTYVFQPRDGSAGTRASFGIPQDAFVVGMVANNKGISPPRKGFPEAFEAFAQFRAARNDAILYVHAEKHGVRHGINLVKLAESCGIPESAIWWTSQFGQEVGIGPESMALLYSTFDVLMNPSYGEGFGIPIIEAQAVGTPVIVTDCTSMPELCGAGWAVGGDRFYDATQESFYTRPRVDLLAEALFDAYDNAATLRGKAREFAVDYDVERITLDYWKPALEELMETT